MSAMTRRVRVGLAAVAIVAMAVGVWAAAQPIDRGDSYCGTVFTQGGSAHACDGALAPYTVTVIVAVIVAVAALVVFIPWSRRDQ